MVGLKVSIALELVALAGWILYHALCPESGEMADPADFLDRLLATGNVGAAVAVFMAILGSWVGLRVLRMHHSANRESEAALREVIADSRTDATAREDRFLAALREQREAASRDLERLSVALENVRRGA